MSTKYLNAAFEAKIDNSIAKSVLVALADNADEQTGIAYPSILTIMHRVGLKSKDPVHDALKFLYKIGVLEKYDNSNIPVHYKKTNLKYKSNQNCYKINLDKLKSIKDLYFDRYQSTMSTSRQRQLVDETPPQLVDNVDTNHQYKPSVIKTPIIPLPGEDGEQGFLLEADQLPVDLNYPTPESVIAYLNAKAGTTYRADAPMVIKKINILCEAGYRLEHFKKVIDNKVLDWKGKKDWEKFLTPSTLFGQKFDEYLGSKIKKKLF